MCTSLSSAGVPWHTYGLSKLHTQSRLRITFSLALSKLLEICMVVRLRIPHNLNFFSQIVETLINRTLDRFFFRDVNTYSSFWCTLILLVRLYPFDKKSFPFGCGYTFLQCFSPEKKNPFPKCGSAQTFENK